MSELINILKYRLVWINITAAIIAVIISFYWYGFSAFAFVLISNLFDIFGYHFALIRRTTQLPEKIIIRSYRINQFLFDVLLLLMIGFVFDWIAALAGWIMKNFGLQDVLYYIFLKMKLPDKWTWMKWTPLGFFKGTLSKSEVLIQSFIGILIAVLLLILR
ncbi:MAG: hypothetical protein HND40_04060 [Ignavibacteriota bacterium]|jgi:hypothetical protein|nr:MAG: hypothetical protein F9K42_13710 [Ignavibacterium sp.]MBL1156009.1 hypothetical protein [Ignavibacteriota bacterium]MCO6447341.1 hypothetical protein [Ignavibacterium album]MCZ2269327.1 hypothetical protein [Ignavibacteriales bacterium]MDX9712769.1 hypothetical protein [Ignavibacteriaceae bacterium]